MASKAQLEANKRYNNKNTFIKTIRFNKVTESEIIDYINQSNEPFATLVKRLIREEIDIQEGKKCQMQKKFKL